MIHWSGSKNIPVTHKGAGKEGFSETARLRLGEGMGTLRRNCRSVFVQAGSRSNKHDLEFDKISAIWYYKVRR